MPVERAETGSSLQMPTKLVIFVKADVLRVLNDRRKGVSKPRQFQIDLLVQL